MRVRLALLVALIASPALAADEPIATAPATAPPTVAEQIDAYLRSSPALEAKEPGAVDGVVPRDERKVHGVVSIGVGTGGYRSVYLQTDMAMGQNGRLSLAFEDTRHGRAYPHRFHGGGPIGLGVVTDLQRCDLEGMTPSRSLDTLGGPHGRCVSRGPAR